MGVSASLKAVWGRSTGGAAKASASRTSSPIRIAQRRRRIFGLNAARLHITRLIRACQQGLDASLRVVSTKFWNSQIAARQLTIAGQVAYSAANPHQQAAP